MKYIDFVFNKKCEKECQCQDGIKSITTKYSGDSMAERIVFYFDDIDGEELCEFINVNTNDEIKCSLEFTIFSRFEENTEFIIFYENGTECKGLFDTSCSTNIYNKFGDGECDKLQVVAFEDLKGNICDDTESENVDNDRMDNQDEALINHNILQFMDKQTYYGIAAEWKTEIIIIISVLLTLIIVAMFFCVYSTKLYFKYNAKPDEP